MKLIPQDMQGEICTRMSKITSLLEKTGVDAILIASNPNIYYSTGRFFRGYVYLPVKGSPVWFVIRPVDIEPEKEVVLIRKPEMIPAELERAGCPLPRKIALEFDDLLYSDVLRLQNVFHDAEVSNGSGIMRSSRSVKTPWEIKRMEEDGVHQAEVYRRITRCYQEDMTDVEFQVEIERILRLEGCLGFIRTSGNLMDINLGSVIAGDNADNPSPYDFTMGGAGMDSSLPGGANGTVLKPGQTVMVDMNGSFNGYQTDMTRVWGLGKIPRHAVKAHDCSRKILRALEHLARPGVPVAHLYEKAMEITRRENLSGFFMGHRQKAPFIGHGVGIELNETPVVTPKSREILAANMTIALEPKFVIPGVGAVGIENTYLVTDNGLRSLTNFPEEIQEL